MFVKSMNVPLVYTVKKEYESEPESENEPPKKMVDLGPRKFEGIGPTTKEGIPLVLRSVSLIIFLLKVRAIECD